MAHLPCVPGAAHQRGEDLVVVLAAAEVSRNAVRQFQSGGIRVSFQESYRGHNEAGHTKGALEPLFVDDALLDGMQRSVLTCQPFDRQDLLMTHGMCEDRARIMRHVVEQDRTGTAFGAV